MCSQKLQDRLDKGTWVALPAWVGIIRFLNPVLIVAGIFYLGQKENDYENRMFETSRQREKVIQHALDDNVHMSLDEKIRYFVPRSELDYRLDVMEENQRKIMEKLNVN